MELNIRRAVNSDINTIIKIQDDAFYEDFVAYGECPAYQVSPEHMELRLDKQLVYVAEIEDTIVGTAYIRILEGDCYDLTILAVAPNYHNRGIGQKIMAFIESDNPQAKTWQLITPFKSYRNHHLYEKCGYKKVGEYKHSDCLNLFEYKKETT